MSHGQGRDPRSRPAEYLLLCTETLFLITTVLAVCVCGLDVCEQRGGETRSKTIFATSSIAVSRVHPSLPRGYSETRREG